MLCVLCDTKKLCIFSSLKQFDRNHQSLKKQKTAELHISNMVVQFCEDCGYLLPMSTTDKFPCPMCEKVVKSSWLSFIPHVLLQPDFNFQIQCSLTSMFPPRLISLHVFEASFVPTLKPSPTKTLAMALSQKWNARSVQIKRPLGLKRSWEVQMKAAPYFIVVCSAGTGKHGSPIQETLEDTIWHFPEMARKQLNRMPHHLYRNPTEFFLSSLLE